MPTTSTGSPAPPLTKEAELLARRLIETKTTQEALAARVGVDPSMVSQWSSGRRPISVDHADAIAMALGIPDPGLLSPTYRRMRAQFGSHSTPGARAPTEIKEDELQVLVTALVATFRTMRRHRPKEADELQQAITRLTTGLGRETTIYQRLTAALAAEGSGV